MKKPIRERIAAAYRKTHDYDRMLRLVFPIEDYPRAWNYSSNGGPPGCAMAFSAAVRRMGGDIRHSPDLSSRTVWIPRRPP